MHTSSHGRFYFPPGPKRLRVRRVRSRTAAESVCGLDVNQSLSQPTKYILLTVHKAPELAKLQAVSHVGVRYTWPLELERTLVNRAYQLTRTLLFPARAETVESTTSTVEDGGRERLWSGCEPKPVSADQIHSTHGTQSPRARETASSIACGN